MNKLDLALNKLQWLICHQTKTKQIKCLVRNQNEYTGRRKEDPGFLFATFLKFTLVNKI